MARSAKPKAAGPPSDFNTVAFATHTIAAGGEFFRIVMNPASAPLRCSTSVNRFSDPNAAKNIEPLRFTTWYAAQSVRTAVGETLVRDEFEGKAANRFLFTQAYVETRIATIYNEAPLVLFEMRDGANLGVGLHTDASSAKSHALGQRWSLAIHEHPAKVDGIVYRSRFTHETNVMIYNRSVAKLAVRDVRRLLDDPELAAALAFYNVKLIAAPGDR